MGLRRQNAIIEELAAGQEPAGRIWDGVANVVCCALRYLFLM